MYTSNDVMYKERWRTTVYLRCRCIPKTQDGSSRTPRLSISRQICPSTSLMGGSCPEVWKSLTSTKSGYVKGGLEAVKKRMTALNTGNPFPMELSTVPCEQPAVFEKYWHLIYGDYRGRGEFFDLTNEQFNYILASMKHHAETGEFCGDQGLLGQLLEKEQARVSSAVGMTENHWRRWHHAQS